MYTLLWSGKGVYVNWLVHWALSKQMTQWWLIIRQVVNLILVLLPLRETQNKLCSGPILYFSRFHSKTRVYSSVHLNLVKGCFHPLSGTMKFLHRTAFTKQRKLLISSTYMPWIIGLHTLTYKIRKLWMIQMLPLDQLQGNK